MDAQIRTGIDICDSVLRYAEVEQYGSRFRLLRLGSCYFEFDVSREVFSSDAPTYLKTIGEAVHDVFAGSNASSMHVAVHPPDCLSFFSPVAPSDPPFLREERLRREALLLSDGSASVRLVSQRLLEDRSSDGEIFEWHHGLAVDERVYERLDRIFEALPGHGYSVHLSTQAAALVAGRLLNRQDPVGAFPLAMAVGGYTGHVEYTLLRRGQWFYSHHVPARSSDDAVFFSVALLQRLGYRPADVGRVYVYGNVLNLAESPLMRMLYPTAPEVLNPTQVVALDPASLAATFDSEAYVPCIGVAL